MEPTLRVLDIKEKDVGAAKPPSFPAPAPTPTGFPQPKKRTRVSAFKQQRQAQTQAHAQSPLPESHVAGDTSGSQPRGPASRQGARHARENTESEEKRAIDSENRAMLDSMSPQEIAQAQQEILNGMDPTLIQMLLRRANLDESKADWPFDPPPVQSPRGTANSSERETADASKLDSAEPPRGEPATPNQAAESINTTPKKTVTFDEDAAPPAPPASEPSTTTTTTQTSFAPNTTHFPRAPEATDLEPSDPDFLSRLHDKFFPNLPADPSKLAWMAPLPTEHSTADRESPYYPGQDAVPVSQLRFDFRGVLLSPRVSRLIPVTAGLHHHGEAPEAAGYTIPELARLARSVVPGQRCIAYRTLGRMLYRLGRGKWGAGEGGRAGEEDDLAFGLWRCFQENRVLDSLWEEAALEDGRGHRSAKAYATEALWLYEKGGWKEKWRGM